MFEKVKKIFLVAMDDWDMMQKTEGDEGEEWAIRFEQHYYDFSDALREWMYQQETLPKTLEEAYELKEIKWIQDNTPAPLQLNLDIEVEEIIEKRVLTRYDD